VRRPGSESGNFHFFLISPFSGQNRVILGGRGGPRIIFFYWNPPILLLRSPCKNLEPYDNPFWGFSNGGNNNKKKEDEKEKYGK
jgi:hypothetical protein